VRNKSLSTIVREYISRVNRYPKLSFDQEARLIDRWSSGDDKALQQLILSSLRYVIYPAQQVAYSYYKRHDYWSALRELIGAGNEGLMLTAGRFRPDSGALFRTAAQPSIRKELIRQALFDRTPASRPYDVTLPRATRLDALRGDDDGEISIPDGPVSPHRHACIVPTDGKHPRGESFSEVLASGYGRLAVEDDDNSLNRKIWHAVRRLRYERPALPTRLKVIAKDVGCSDARISQITGKTSHKIHAAIMSNPQRVRRFPSWRNIDDWCDQSKEYRDGSIQDWQNASDYNIKRIELAIAAGDDVPAELQFTTPDGYTPAVHFAGLVIRRRIAERQDAEQAARVEAYKELKRAERLERLRNEERVTLTAKGHEECEKIDRERQTESRQAAFEQGGGQAPPPIKKIAC
jgi:DNA-directed RNA polymerase specialized sigma subunit